MIFDFTRSTSMKVLAEANLKFKCLLDCTGFRSITVSLCQTYYTSNLSIHGRGPWSYMVMYCISPIKFRLQLPRLVWFLPSYVVANLVQIQNRNFFRLQSS
uniref:Putative ovule protein n=1 Tax=Solanum chacoense TaxID=4108 RepID=A0A0V0GKR8_SOLCH